MLKILYIKLKFFKSQVEFKMYRTFQMSLLIKTNEFKQLKKSKGSIVEIFSRVFFHQICNLARPPRYK